MLASLLRKHGVSEAIVSPGSRNAPLLVALEREPGINQRVVIDERSAAFIALGLSAASQCPVAMVCTSGTAPLNYGPAIAEAYYRGIPLIAITADRPAEWIDQDDSQTIRQPGIYTNFIKGTFDIPAETDSPDCLWTINRMLNEAISLASQGRPGPVHINIRLADPLGEVEETDLFDPYGDDTRCFTTAAPVMPMATFDNWETLGARLAPHAKVLILAGFMEPCSIDAQLRELSRRPNIVVMHEAQSNLKGYGDFITNIDATLRQLKPQGNAAAAPDIVITLGGALTSRMVKAWLRTLPEVEHWSISDAPYTADVFRHLSLRLPWHPSAVIPELVKHVPKRKNSEISSFKAMWLKASEEAMAGAERWADEGPWCDFKAMRQVMATLPRGWNLQLSNGTAVRYAQLFDSLHAGYVGCNRGVSGIDGSTSTAIGAALASDEPTVLITGDMSMQYDIGALGCTFIPRNFKIIVLNNGGGGIFRFISTTRSLDELEKCFVGDIRLPLKQLAAAYGFKHLVATDESSLEKSMKKLASANSQPIILEILTDGAVSATRLQQYFNS